MKKDGWYYLITAEGGTGFNHALSIARSRSVWGPYDLHPQNPVLTARDKENAPLKSAGHGNFVRTPRGEWLLVHLCMRPIYSTDERAENSSPISAPKSESNNTPCSVLLGRETAMQNVTWPDGDWPRLTSGTNVPAASVCIETEGEPPAADAWDSFSDFDTPDLDIHFQTLREPANEDWLSFSLMPGHLSIRGRDSLHSWFDQSLIARRVQHFKCSAETCLKFTPTHFKHSAGLIVYTDYRAYKYLQLSCSSEQQVQLTMVNAFDGGKYDFIPVKTFEDQPVAVYLRVEFSGLNICFEYSQDGKTWHRIPKTFSALELGNWGKGVTSEFTGTFVGMACQDLLTREKWAHFDYFKYNVNP
jgi:xylan 1,4-beta-xylosidase